MAIDFNALKFASIEPPKRGGDARVSVGVSAKGKIRVTMNSAALKRLGAEATRLSVKAASDDGRDYLLLAPAGEGWLLTPFGMKNANGERGAGVTITAHPFTIGVQHNALEARVTWLEDAMLVEMPDWAQMRVECGVDDEDAA